MAATVVAAPSFSPFISAQDPSLRLPRPRPKIASPLAFSTSKLPCHKALRFIAPYQTVSLRFSPLPVRSAVSEETTTEPSAQFPWLDDLVVDLKSKWEAVEDKPTICLYGGSAFVAFWVSSSIISAISSIPLFPKVMELIGSLYSVWFVFRYLLFKENRKELLSDIEELKAKIIGDGKYDIEELTKTIREGKHDIEELEAKVIVGEGKHDIEELKAKVTGEQGKHRIEELKTKVVGREVKHSIES